MINKLLNVFKTKPLLDSESADWIFEAFHWALTNFDSQEFFNRSKLIQPTNQFFPGGVNSVHAKAENIFKHTLNHAGLSHWPFQLQPPEHFQNLPVQPMNVDSFKRHSAKNTLPVLSSAQPIYISYNPQQTLKPEDLSSSYAHVLAQHLTVQSQQLPPGGPEYFAEGTEILAIFMGFGVMFSNSAYTFRGGCGSCYNAQANRQASLSENEVIFALALYCRLKDIPYSEATRHLKTHLKTNYKQAIKQIEDQQEHLSNLLAFKQ